jgi:SAM-dependent methyltransferase
MKPYAESCDQNRDPILGVIAPLFRTAGRVLEIGSGTGQHAVYFASRMEHLQWLASDRAENHAGISLWLAEAALPNLTGPLLLDVAHSTWPDIEVDAVFTANTLHIMHWPEVCALFNGVGRVLSPSSLFVAYGPFNYGGAYTSDSNARFDQWLKQRDSGSGIRDFDALNELAGASGLGFLEEHKMPANNRILVWQRL